MAIGNRESRIENQGFTLIEILLAIGILAVGITAVLSLFMMGARSHRRAADRTRAALLADTVINQIKADLAESLPPNRYKEDGASIWLLDPATGLEIKEQSKNPATHADFPEFRYYVTLTKLYPDPASRDYYKAKVIVVWDTEGLNATGTVDARNSDWFETIVRRKNY